MSRRSTLPDGLANETLRTLRLLFPEESFSIWSRANRRRRRWLTKICARWTAKTQRSVDTRLAKCGTPDTDGRQPANFNFWRERLDLLKEAYDDATPATFDQWWHDRRNGVQWYTFWVAVLVLVITTFLGVVQCIEGALQVYKAYTVSQ
jgi:hypothetical protein